MHLRVTEEAEMVGLDVDQFFDEQIGDWAMFEELAKRREELEKIAENSSAETSGVLTPKVAEVSEEPVKNA